MGQGMLTTEQRDNFRKLVERASKIAGSTSIHIRVSGRQLGDKSWCVGLIFGKKGHSEWLKIADVVETDLLEAKTDYRAELQTLIH